MKNYEINITQTANPTIIKFETNHFLIKNSSVELNNIDEAKDSPLAQQLFHLPFVKKVYISSNFIAVERYDIVQWQDVQEEVAEQIKNYLNNGGAVIKEIEDTKSPITVYAESTPNPSVMKFVANKKIAIGSYEFKNIDETANAPLAQKLFHFPFVKEIFVDENYISITKFDIAEWNDITMEIREFIKSSLEEGIEVVKTTGESNVKKASSSTSNNIETQSLDPTSKQIVDILDEYIKPAVQSDGGNIMFQSYDKDTKKVEVILQGACSGCPSSTFTLKNGIENMLKEMLHEPSIVVEAVNG